MDKLTRLHPEVNAYTLTFDPTLLEEIRDSYRRDLEPFLRDPTHQRIFAGGSYLNQPAGPHYHMISYDTDPLLWFTNASASTFQLFRRFFTGLGIEEEIKQLVDYARQITMYCGFLVICDRALDEMWHYDYRPGANAYTLITPLYDLAPSHGHLRYEIDEQNTATYRYALGEAIILGEGFLHTTEVFEPGGKLRVLVSLTFGTDKWEHWNILRQNIEEQSYYFALPCGHISGTCLCQARHRFGKAWEWFRP